MLEAVREQGIETRLRGPVLSFVVSNYNYGRFLDQSVGSIFAQTYPHIECIVVDDASSDESAAVLDRLVARHPGLVVVRNETNLGQTRSCIRGFERSTGQYIALVDADDILLPDYALTHLRAHMLLREPVGFSTCDNLQSVDDRIVRTFQIDNSLIEQNSWVVAPSDLRDLPPELDQFSPCDAPPALRRISDHTTAWVWGPTSSSVYRRDALDMLMDNPRIGKLKFATDAYLNFALNALCGSVLIDRSLVVYRIHGGNNFARTASLRSLRSFEVDLEYGSFAAYCALEHIIMNFERFHARCHSFGHLSRVLTTLSRKARQPMLLARLEKAAVQFLRRMWQRRLPGLLPHRR